MKRIFQVISSSTHPRKLEKHFHNFYYHFARFASVHSITSEPNKLSPRCDNRDEPFYASAERENYFPLSFSRSTEYSRLVIKFRDVIIKFRVRRLSSTLHCALIRHRKFAGKIDCRMINRRVNYSNPRWFFFHVLFVIGP